MFLGLFPFINELLRSSLLFLWRKWDNLYLYGFKKWMTVMKRLYNDILSAGTVLRGHLPFHGINFHFWYHFMEQYMMFQYTDDYFQELMKAPGGLSEYFTEYVSQLFYNDLGAPLVLAVLLTLMAGLFHRFLCYCGSKVAIWAAMIPAFLFWIFRLSLSLSRFASTLHWLWRLPASWFVRRRLDPSIS